MQIRDESRESVDNYQPEYRQKYECWSYDNECINYGEYIHAFIMYVIHTIVKYYLYNAIRLLLCMYY